MTIFAYFCALFKGVIYGSTIFFIGRLTESTDVLDVLALRFLLSFVVVWILKTARVVKISVGVKDFFGKSEKTPFLRNLLLTAMFEPVLYMLFETFGISQTTGITAAVIISLSPIVYCICEELMLKERSTVVQKIFLACGIIGAMYVSVSTSTTDGKNSILGILSLFCAITAGALFCVFSRKSSHHFASMEITYISCMLGAVIFNAVNIVRHLVRGDVLSYFDPYFNLDNMIGFFVLGIMATIVATAMNNYALSKLQVSTVAAFGGVSTIVSIAIGVIFNDEKLMTYHYIGLPFILACIVGVSAISIMKSRKNMQK